MIKRLQKPRSDPLCRLLVGFALSILSVAGLNHTRRPQFPPIDKINGTIDSVDTATACPGPSGLVCTSYSILLTLQREWCPFCCFVEYLYERGWSARAITPGMNYHFKIHKATEAACFFVEKEGGRINIMKLIKLMYLLDRHSVQDRGIPVVGGTYFSMRNGPVVGEVLDLLNEGSLDKEPECRWAEFISDRENHEVELKQSPGTNHLSPAELQLLDDVYKKHGSSNPWQLRDWCHERCGEWTPMSAGRESISIEDIALNTGYSPQDAHQLSDEAKEANLLDLALTHG